MNEMMESPPPDLFDEDDVSVNVSRVSITRIIDTRNTYYLCLNLWFVNPSCFIQIELAALQRKPACFIIAGKPVSIHAVLSVIFTSAASLGSWEDYFS